MGDGGSIGDEAILLLLSSFKEKSKKQERQRIIVFPQSLISLLLVMSTLFYCSFSMVFGESKLTLFLLIFHLINSLHSKSLDQLQLSFFFVSFFWFNGISKQFCISSNYIRHTFDVDLSALYMVLFTFTVCSNICVFLAWIRAVFVPSL